ncbi:virulence factor Mce family protein [Rhodococcus aetherivorans]|uniref:MlaD family protein n=1 Tax=Rhodococcus aetherivorans TaxID=191292 RepID=A0AA46NWX6_9NOCA|nr:MlaD family protein [Rhodococcus aetherivorans]ETT28968.1 Mammalian cell entry related domain protein [Rhodococcus rhodochrous ATCC 21198]UYF95609.1 MlaD family protein [Rhodococcus aetherivorans]WKW97641.1 MlaD family protein [Rhodococcus aetherivorans]GES39760.1 virulence factor Mce family protein [Rhodococcus aetherivorans]
MQRTVKSAWTRFGTARLATWLGNDMRIGAGVVAVAVLALVATTVLYISPPGRKVVAFETTDASAISVGQDVRIAGVSVGKVTDMELGQSTVRVSMEVEDDVLVGTESRVEVRMLTPVGGYAITLVPLGVRPLDEGALPVGQVTVPYSIGDVLQAAPNTTDNVDGGTIDANLVQVAEALQQNPDSVGSIISGMTAIARVMDRQREQVRTVTGLASEYLQTFNANRELVFHLIREMDMVLSTYNTNHAGFNEAYRLLGHVLMTVAPYEEYYLDHRDEVAAAITQVRAMIEEFNASMGPSIDALTAAREQLANWLTPEGLATISGGTLMASDICIPVPGRQC